MSGACSTPSSAEKQIETSGPKAFGAPDSMQHETMSQVVPVTDDTFEAEVLASDVPVIIDFYATWCSPCRTLSPILDRLASEFAGQIKFVKVNTDEEPDLASGFKVTSLPTIAFVDEGKNAGQFSGLPQEDELRNELYKWLESGKIHSQ